MDPLFAQELRARASDIDAVVAARDAAERAGIDELYLIGGAVRDLFREIEPVDIDLAVDGDPSALASALASVTAPFTGESAGELTRFGTVTVRRGDVRYDIARTRTESYSHPGALPDVEPAPIGQDLLRRDFTVNAIALGLSGVRDGQVLAAPGALDDASSGRLAVLHGASFEDDPTRLLRLARYQARLQFEVAADTRELAYSAIESGALQTISGNRVGNELRLLAHEPDPVAAFIAVSDLGLPWSLNPERTRRAVDVLPADGRRDLLVLAAVFADDGQGVAGQQSGEPALAAELDRLGFKAADRDTIVEGVIRAPQLAERLRSAGSASEIARAVGAAGVETLALASTRGATEQSMRWLGDLRHRRLEITGVDLVERGVEAGPAVGIALQAATDALLDGTAPDRRSQLTVAVESAR